jgi:hypothetical protein
MRAWLSSGNHGISRDDLSKRCSAELTTHCGGPRPGMSTQGKEHRYMRVIFELKFRHDDRLCRCEPFITFLFFDLVNFLNVTRDEMKLVEFETKCRRLAVHR